MNTQLINKTKDHVLALLDEKTPENVVYHNSDHTLEVAEAVETIGRGMNVSDEELEMLIISALFHDFGYLEKADGHEIISAKYAREFLSNENYPKERIKIIEGCILATKVPQKPKTKLEEIMCDADLSHLGKISFDKRNNMFRDEFEFHFGRALTEKEWLEKSIEFLHRHRFFTEYALNNFDPIKKNNLQKLQNELDSLEEENTSINNSNSSHKN